MTNLSSSNEYHVINNEYHVIKSYAIDHDIDLKINFFCIDVKFHVNQQGLGPCKAKILMGGQIAKLTMRKR